MKALVSLLAIALVAGCNYNRMKGDGQSSGVVNVQNVSQVDYSVVQGAVIGPKCVGCHSAAGGNQGGTNLESYKTVRGLLNRIAYRSLVKKDMPPRGGLSDSAGQLLKAWIDNGAPERIDATTEPPDPTLDIGLTDWQKVSTKIFDRKCNQCHSGADPQGGLDLTSLATVKTKASVIFERTVVKQDMPVAPYPMLTPRERRVLLDWFNQGMPN